MEGGTATFTISTSMAPETPLIISYSMSGNAIPHSEYTLDGVIGQVTIPAGGTSATVTLVAPSNPKKKGTETATMNVAAGAYGVSTSSASVTIRNVKKVAAPAFALLLPESDTVATNTGDQVNGDATAAH